jgi:hypothetical protein
MLTLVNTFLIIRSTCLPQFSSLDMGRSKGLCSDTMLMIVLSIMSGGWSGRLDFLDTIILSVLSGLNLTSHENWGKHVDLIIKKVFTRVNIMRKF